MNHCKIASDNAERHSWSSAWRLECEARALLALPLVQRRLELAVPARAKRRKELEVDMKRLWDEARGGSA